MKATSVTVSFSFKGEEKDDLEKRYIIIKLTSPQQNLYFAMITSLYTVLLGPSYCYNNNYHSSLSSCSSSSNTTDVLFLLFPFYN